MRTAQADGVELHQDHVADQLFGQVGVLAHQISDVVEDRDIGKQRAKLEQHAHPSAHRVELGVIHAGHRLAVDGQRPARRLQLAADQAQQRRLAAARAAHDRNELAARNLEIDSVEDRPVVVREIEV